MKVDILRIALAAGKVLTTVIRLVPILEALKQSGKVATSAQAREQVIDGAMAALLTAEDLAGRDLVNDAELRALAGAVVDVVVHFHNALASKAAAPAR